MRADLRTDTQPRLAALLQPYGDGKKIAWAVAADEDKGTITRYKPDETGRPHNDPETGKPEIETLHFKEVEIFIARGTPERTIHEIRRHYGKHLKLEPGERY